MDTTPLPNSTNLIGGLSILLTGVGTIEIHHTMQTVLVELGYEVYWEPANLKNEVFDRSIDLVFHFSLLSCGSKYISELRKNLDKKNPRAIIIDMPLSHPILDSEALGFVSVDEINTFLRDRKVVQWIHCSTSQKEYKEYGFTNSFFAPLGLDNYLLIKKDHTSLYGEWINNKSNIIKVKRSQIRDKNLKSFEPLLKNKIVYAGSPNSPWEKLLSPNLGNKFEFLKENFLPNSKEIFQKMIGMEIEPGNLRGFIEYHHLWSVYVPLQRRRKMVQILSEHFPEYLSVWGDGWGRYIKGFYETSTVPRQFYDQALCCLDFGSLGIDSPLYGRTCEIIKSDGLLISGRSSETTDLVEENQFETTDQLIKVIEEVLDPSKRSAKFEKQKLLYENYSFKKIICHVIEEAYKNI